MNELILGFDLDLWQLDETDQLTFGRVADVCIHNDPELDAKLGLVERRGDQWWLRNVGSTITMTIRDSRAEASHLVYPGCSTEISGDSFEISFAVGKEHYEVKGTCWPRTGVDNSQRHEMTHA